MRIFTPIYYISSLLAFLPSYSTLWKMYMYTLWVIKCGLRQKFAKKKKKTKTIPCICFSPRMDGRAKKLRKTESEWLIFNFTR